MDALIAPLQAQAAASASASTAIAETVASARREALAVIAAVDATIHNKEFSGLRRQKEKLQAALPALLGPILTEMAVVDRAGQVALAPSLPGALEAMLDELAARPLLPLEEAPAPAKAEEEPGADATPEPSAPSPEPARCDRVRSDGERCRGRALPGLSVCVLHRRAETRTAEGAVEAVTDGAVEAVGR